MLLRIYYPVRCYMVITFDKRKCYVRTSTPDFQCWQNKMQYLEISSANQSNACGYTQGFASDLGQYLHLLWSHYVGVIYRKPNTFALVEVLLNTILRLLNYQVYILKPWGRTLWSVLVL